MAPAHRLAGEVVGGAVAALVIAPAALATGLVMFAPLGPSHAAQALMAGFVTLVVAGLAGLVMGDRHRLHLYAPRTAQAALIASLLASAADRLSPLQLAALAALVLALCGLAQIIVGLTGLSAIAKVVPLPLVAGFGNGLALQVILGMAPRLVGPHGTESLAAALSWPLGLAGVTMAAMLASARRWPAFPPAISGLAAGTAGWYLAAAAGIPADTLGERLSGWPVGDLLTVHLPSFGALWNAPEMAGLAGPTLSTVVALTAVSSIQTLLSAVQVEDINDGHHDGNREMLRQGVTNLVNALAGGAPSGGSILVTRVAWRQGGRSAWCNLSFALAVLLLGGAAARMVAALPLTVMIAAVLVSVAQTMDPQTTRLVADWRSAGHPHTRRHIRANLLLTLLVTAAVVLLGPLEAVALGAAAAFLSFLRGSNDALLRRVYFGDHFRSMTARSPQAAALLERHGHSICVVEVMGPLYFGSVDTLVGTCDALAQGSDQVLLDLRWVGSLDTTAARLLDRLDRRLAGSGKRLLLFCPVDSGDLRAAMRDLGLVGPERDGRLFADFDDAMTDAENVLIARLRAQGAGTEMPIAEHPGLAGLSAAGRDRFVGRLRRQVHPAGRHIVREGEDGDRMFFLCAGQVSIRKPSDADPAGIRLASYSAGVAFGEMALLTGMPRSADVVADSDCVAWELGNDDFKALCAEDPQAGVAFALGLAGGLAMRLGEMSVTIRELKR